MMAQFGRDTWRANGEIFTVWFRLLGRLAPYALVDEDGRVRRRPFASGLLEGGWRDADVVLIALGDRLDPVRRAVADAALVRPLRRARRARQDAADARVPRPDRWSRHPARASGSSGRDATAAGFLPIAAGYLIAHYLTYLLIDGQHIVVAISDPFQQRLGPVRDGVLRGRRVVAAAGPRLDRAAGGRRRRPHARRLGRPCRRDDGRADGHLTTRAVRTRQVPLAVVMVALTTLTLWSLGQAIVVTTPTAPAVVEPAAGPQAGTTTLRG